MMARLCRWLGIGPYTPCVPPALRRRPTWYGARSNGHVRSLAGLTPEEAWALSEMEQEQRMIRARMQDAARWRQS